MRRYYSTDYILLIIVGILLLFGILILASVSAFFSQEKFGKPTYYFSHQLIYGLLPGIILGFFLFKIPLSFLKKWAWLFVLVNLFLAVLVFVPGLGVVAGGAPRWLNLRFAIIQPSEFLKLTFILYLATLLAARTKKVQPKRNRGSEKFTFRFLKENERTTLIPFLIVIGIIVLLLTEQSDISTLGVIIFTALLMYFSSGTPLWHTILVVAIAGVSLAGLVKFVPYRMMRLKVLLGLIKDPMGIGYQIKQALITIGSGGIFGVGLGMSNQKFGFIPQTMSDSIFAVFAEETGFVGSLILIILFLAFLWRGFRIAKMSQDKFSQLFAIGVSSWIVVQAFINIGAMIGLLPLTGIPLPLISYGGSHIVAELGGIGILLNISKRIKK